MSEKRAELWIRRPEDAKPKRLSYRKLVPCPTCGHIGEWAHQEHDWPEFEARYEAHRLARASEPEGVLSVWVQRGDEILCAAGEKAKELGDAGAEVALA